MNRTFLKPGTLYDFSSAIYIIVDPYTYIIISSLSGGLKSFTRKVLTKGLPLYTEAPQNIIQVTSHPKQYSLKLI